MTNHNINMKDQITVNDIEYDFFNDIISIYECQIIGGDGKLITNRLKFKCTDPNDNGEWVVELTNDSKFVIKENELKFLSNKESVLNDLIKKWELMLGAWNENLLIPLKHIVSATLHHPLISASERGKRLGENYFDDQYMWGGRVTKKSEAIESAKNVIQWEKDGDSRLWDIVPNSPLAGEWSGDYSIRDLLSDTIDVPHNRYEEFYELCQNLGMEYDWHFTSQSMADAFNESFNDSYIKTMIESAKSFLESESES